MTDDHDDEHEVGYRRPPRHTRFQKGKSGNPAGRPRGARDLRGAMLDELRRPVTVKENGRSVRVTKGQLLMKALIAKGVAGDMKAAALLLALIHKMDAGAQPEAAIGGGSALEPDDAAIIAAFEQRRGRGGGHD
ncbi:DUF5681 domain-containing protein [Falsiroseomonas sp. HW251]|uniref:DUF5681 domain-containing protein n=1 Tax=Falsiroseomonas sp. HW251 TaxID=3390998 RepID=UPI003D311F2C